MPTISEEVMEEFDGCLRNGRVYNPRLRQEWLKAKCRSLREETVVQNSPQRSYGLNSRSGAGKQGAKARWQKDGQNYSKSCHENMAKSWQNDGYTGTVTETETSTEKQEPMPRKKRGGNSRMDSA